ncbi:peroxide stress protein YaaA [Flavobacteriaceae bacterium]|nr:peroxide stress protein YaaA [Flavobacteriaceae bacterium]
MKMIISPAKSLNFESVLPTQDYTNARFLTEAERINRLLKKKSVKAIGKLMGISENLSTLNWQRNQDFRLPFTQDNARPAVFAFDGDVYTGLDAYSLPQDKIPQLQEQLRILSGLYGILKPLDLIQPYRLEMGTKFPVGVKKNLPAFWKDKVTQSLNEELADGETFLNLASSEYFAAVDTKALKVEVVTPHFKDFKNGKLKMISFFAKKARGMMVRYVVDHNCTNLDDIKGFSTDGYQYSETHTEHENQPVFIR